MTNLVLPNSLTNGTTADATQVMANFNAVGNVVNGNVDATNLAPGIALLLASTGTARKVAFGVDTVTGGGAAPVATKTVTHGLGTTPVVAFVISSSHSEFIGSANALTGTTFTANLRHNQDTNWGSTVTYYWLAIG